MSTGRCPVRVGRLGTIETNGRSVSYSIEVTGRHVKILPFLYLLIQFLKNSHEFKCHKRKKLNRYCSVSKPNENPGKFCDPTYRHLNHTPGDSTHTGRGGDGESRRHPS